MEQTGTAEERRRLQSELPNRGATIIPYDPPPIKRVTGSASTNLPFGDGSGVPLGVPPGSRGYFEGRDNPSIMWEILACPVLDPTAFLTNPIYCWVGDNAGSNLIGTTDPRCKECTACWQPLALTAPDVDGICIPTLVFS
jgi:hypothetical protein